MVGPNNGDCDCHCLTVPPDCFGCTPVNEVPDNILIAASGFSWLFPEEHHGTEVVRIFPGAGTYHDTNTDHNTYSRPLSNINSAATLYRKPDGTCQWLWNDVRAMKTVWKCHKPSGVLTLLDELDHYEPLNASDPSNPWNRVIEPVVDARCSASIQCTASLADATVLTLTPQRIIVTDAINGYFTVATGPDDGVWYWVIDISIRIGRSSISSGIGAAVPGPANGNATLYGCANPVFYAHATPFNTTDLSWSSASTPPYRYKSALGGMFPIGGQVLTYIRAINCATDFDGSLLSLTYAKRSAFRGAFPGYWDMTYPSTVSIQLPVS